PTVKLVYQTAVDYRTNVLQTVGDMREPLPIEFLRHRAQRAILVLLVAVTAAHGAHQPGTTPGVDAQHRTAVYLLPQQRFHGTGAKVNVIARCRGAGQTHPLECVKASPLGNAALGISRW